MVRLIAISNPRAAQAFIDYMASRSITLRLEKEDAHLYAIWLDNLADQVETEAELKAFLRNPSAEKYKAASWTMADTRTATFHYPNVPILQSMKQKAGPVTFVIMILVLGVYAEQLFGHSEQMFRWLHFPETASQYVECWRPFTHAFLHFSTTHIVFNLLWWFVLGGEIEKRIGSMKLLSIFLLSAWGAGFAQFIYQGPNFGGLSGVVYALMGYTWMMMSFASARGLHIEKPYVHFMLFWLALGFFDPFGMNIANMAHLFGLFFGVIIGLMDAKFGKSNNVTQS